MKSPRPVIYGEVLFDQFPDGSVVLGGAPFNVAWHLQAFGASPLLISRVGNDALGRNIRDAMIAWGMDTAGLQLDSVHPTGRVAVNIIDGEPSYDIVKDSAYDFIDSSAIPPLNDNSLLYHGSLALRNSVSRESLAGLKRQLSGPCFVDINLRDPWWSMEFVKTLLNAADMIKLNDIELQSIYPEDSAETLLEKVKAQLLVITLGAKGAEAYTTEFKKLSVSPEAGKSVVDTVGAGDAFSSVLILGHLMGWSIQQTLERAQQFASSVVGIRGATTKNEDFYQLSLDSWK